MLHKKNFHQIEENDIELLIQTGETENVNLEFKSRIEKSDAGKKNLLKVVSSFANTLGGYLIVGLGEESGASAKIYPFEKTEIDEEIRRLESIVHHNIEPRIQGLRTREVKCENNGGSVILMHVPRSYNPPHGVNLNDDIRFYVRRTAHCEQPSVEELRLLFGQQRDIEERVKSFILQRFLRIQSNQGAVPLTNVGNAMILHLIPLQDFGTEKKHDLRGIYEKKDSIQIIGDFSKSEFINLDGVVLFQRLDNFCSYTLVRRNGAIESVMDSFKSEDYELPTFGMVKWLDKIVTAHMKFLESMGVFPPILFCISYFGMHGVHLVENNFPLGRKNYEDVIHLPTSTILEYNNDDKYLELIREQINFLYNTFGLLECKLIDKNFKFIKKYEEYLEKFPN